MVQDVTAFTAAGCVIGTWIGVLAYYKEFSQSTRKWPVDFDSVEPYNMRMLLYPVAGALVVGAAARILAS